MMRQASLFEMPGLRRMRELSARAGVSSAGVFMEFEELERLRSCLLEQCATGKENAGGGNSTVDILERLAASKLTINTLRQTDIGRAVASVAKVSTDPRVKTLAAKLVKIWKQHALEEAQEGKRDVAKGPQASAASSSRAARDPADVRAAARDLLARALRAALPDEARAPPGAPAESLSDVQSSAVSAAAAGMEQAAFGAAGGGTEKAYRGRVRALAQALPRNAALRRAVLEGSLPPARAAILSPMELASWRPPPASEAGAAAGRDPS